MRPILSSIIALAAFLAVEVPPIVHGQAYCALRDPVSTIQEFAPGSSGHRSIVETVSGSARAKVSEKLPFTIHFNELGKHTLYVVLKDGRPDGLVHARSEKGKWGLVEIVWFFDLDLNVQPSSLSPQMR